MSVATVHVLHGIQSGSLFLSQITNARPVTGLEKIMGMPTGLPFPLFAAEIGQAPSCGFECEQIATLLGQTNALTGGVDLSANNTDLLMKKVQQLGRRVADGTAQHKRLRLSKAFLLLDRISAGHRQTARASCRLIAVFDGTNAPIIAAGSLTLSGTPTAAEYFTAGPMELNVDGSGLFTVPAIQDLTIDFRRQVIVVGGDGELYVTFAAVGSYSPVITVRTLDFNWDTYGINGHSITAGVWYLRAKGTPPISDAAFSHVKFTAAAGMAHVDESSTGGNQAAMTTVVCELVGANAATEPIGVALNQQIT